MGTYNILHATIQCPRCGVQSATDIYCYFGRKWLLEYRLGDTYAWVERKMPHNGGRPEGGDLDGEGYAECPACHKDFFVKVHVRADVIEGVSPDAERQGYIPDD